MSSQNDDFFQGKYGVLMDVYKQGPLVREIGIRKVLILSEVIDGPEDNLITMEGGANVTLDKEGNFQKRLNESKGQVGGNEFEKVHTFAAARMTLTMFQRAFELLGYYLDENGERVRILRDEDCITPGQFNFRKKWKRQLRLAINPENFTSLASHYAGRAKIRFGSQLTSKGTVYSCESFDIIAHEVGHAVLYAVWKGRGLPHTDERFALGEAFSDLSAIFAVLAQLDMCEAAIVHSKGDLLGENFLQLFAQGQGEKDKIYSGRLRSIREFAEVVDYDKVKLSGPHRFSQVYSGAIYYLIVAAFKYHLKVEMYDPAETLFRVARYVNAVNLGAYYLSGLEGNATIENVAEKFLFLIKNMRGSIVIGDYKFRLHCRKSLIEIFAKRGVQIKMPK